MVIAEQRMSFPFTLPPAGVTPRQTLLPLTNVSSQPEPTGDRRTTLPTRRGAGAKPAREPAPPQGAVSVNEMLSQLRSPDGTRRRRRSEQPVYTKRRRRRTLLIAGVSAAVLLIGGWYGVKFFQRLRLEGETFRQGVNRRISAALGCKVDFTRIHEGGDRSLAATDATLTTMDDGLLESARFTSLNASLTGSSWFSNEWGIRTLSIAGGVLKLNPGRVHSQPDAKPLAAVKESGDGFRWSISPEPDVITMDAVRILNGLDIEWPSAAAGEMEAVRKLTGGVKLPAGGGMEGTFIKGLLTARGLPEISLETVTWKLSGTRLEIPGARATLGPRTLVEITGHADLVPDGSVALKLNIVDTQLLALLPAAWRERVSGALTTQDCTFTAGFGQGPERSLSGSFTVKGALLNGIGFTRKLAHFLQRTDLEILEFPELTGKFTWSPSAGLEISALSAERESFIRLAGAVTVTPAGDVKGRLNISVSELALNARAVAVPHPFKPTAEGWAGISCNIGGTAASISDDIPVPGAPAAAPGLLPGGAAQPDRPAAVTPASDPEKDARAERAFESLLEP